jgi:asparagine synthase (glutamine-hydrolysing)
MVNFVIVVDPENKQRASFISKAKKLLPLVDGLITHTCSNESFSAVWASGPWTPLSQTTNGEGTAIIWGDAIAGPGPERLDADRLLSLWKNPSAKMPEALDGFHAAVAYHPERNLVAGVDLLGVFPFYYYTMENVLLIGSSPELFRYHPSFEMELDLEGLVGILLTKGLFDGKTLLHGVKRLSPGHLLIRDTDGSVKEVAQYTIPVSTKYCGYSLSEQVNILDQRLNEAFTRHMPTDDRYCLLLSGGVDSRLVGGYLQRRSIDTVALTEGLDTDNDVKWARLIAKTLDFEHRRVTVRSGNYAEFANLSAKWEHLASGCSGIMFWGLWPHLRKIGSRVVSGFIFDAIMGALVDWAYSPSTHSISYDKFFESVNSWGFRPDMLKKLLKEEYHGDIISKTLRAIRKEYDSYSKLEFQRAFCFGIYHRMRFHVGSVLWLLSFGAWPVLPYVDRKIIEVTAGMPVDFLLNRHAQKELVCRKFPELAKLPVARADFGQTYDPTPLIPTTRQRIMQYFYGYNWIWKLRGLGGLRGIIFSLTKESPYWQRESDFNSAGWKSVRRLAAPCIKETFDLFNEKMIENLLPDPEVNFAHGRWMTETASLKSLLCFSLWLQSHHAIKNIHSETLIH